MRGSIGSAKWNGNWSRISSSNSCGGRDLGLASPRGDDLLAQLLRLERLQVRST